MPHRTTRPFWIYMPASVCFPWPSRRAGHAADIIAVEGDRAAAEDLKRNARPYARLHAHVANVEDVLAARRDPQAPTTIVDPPRTGLSKQASDGLVRHGSPRLIYVSCDPPTLARDARKLLDAGTGSRRSARSICFQTRPTSKRSWCSAVDGESAPLLALFRCVDEGFEQ